MLDVVWTNGAESDLQSIFENLESVSEGAGDQFLSLVNSAVKLLRPYPETAPYFKRPFRRLLLRDRRHGLFYSVEARGIIIHAIADLRRDPEDLERRFRRFLD